jgi:2-methylfumaryl-CoA isomerase
VMANPMFAPLDQPRIGSYLAPGLPMSIDGTYPPAVAAPAVGDDTAAVLAECLGLSPDEIRRLTESGTVA